MLDPRTWSQAQHIACLLLVGLLPSAYATMQAITTLQNSSRSEPVIPSHERLAPAISTTSVVNTARVFDTRMLRTSPLFGEEKISLASVEDTVALPDTALPLKLQGIFSYDSETSEARALIQSEGTSKSYSVNDKIADQRKIVAIYPDVVLLQSAEGIERLTFSNSTPVVVTRPSNPSPSANQLAYRSPEKPEIQQNRPIPMHQRKSLRERLQRK